MKKYRLSQISIQAIISIPILILTSVVFYSIGKNQVFYSSEILISFAKERWPYLVCAWLAFWGIFSQKSFANIVYWTFISLFFVLGIVEFRASTDKVALAVLFLSVIVSTIIAFVFSSDTKSAYMKGLVSESDLMMAPKKQIKILARKTSDNNDRPVMAFLSNWDNNGGFFHLIEQERFGLDRIELEIEFGGVKFYTSAKIVKINYKEAGYGFIVDKNLPATGPAWHNFLSLLSDLGLNPELVV